MWLLDCNTLIALACESHVDHHRARKWFYEFRREFATGPTTQGAPLRHALRLGQDMTAAKAWRVLESVVEHIGHQFWPDSLPYAQVAHGQLSGHRQVTDFYLAELARQHGGRLATMDYGLTQAHPDAAEFVPKLSADEQLSTREESAGASEG